MLIKILGTGCPNCKRLESNVQIALEQSGIEATVEKVTDIANIMTYGVMGAPALVIDEKLVSAGKVNTVDEVVDFLNGGGAKKATTGCCGCSCGGNC